MLPFINLIMSSDLVEYLIENIQKDLSLLAYHQAISPSNLEIIKSIIKQPNKEYNAPNSNPFQQTTDSHVSSTSMNPVNPWDTSVTEAPSLPSYHESTNYNEKKSAPAIPPRIPPRPKSSAEERNVSTHPSNSNPPTHYPSNHVSAPIKTTFKVPTSDSPKPSKPEKNEKNEALKNTVLHSAAGGLGAGVGFGLARRII